MLAFGTLQSHRDIYSFVGFSVWFQVYVDFTHLTALSRLLQRSVIVIKLSSVEFSQ